MKKTFIFLIGLSSFFVQSQELTPFDAIPFMSNSLYGTARFQSVSGAMGAIGADLSAINLNPAGSIMFNNNYLSVTASNHNKTNYSTYFNSKGKSKENALDLSQIGGVFVFKNNNPSASWSKIALSINYEKIQNLDDDIFVRGTNPNNSIDRYFINKANGVILDDIQTLPNETISELYAYLGEMGDFNAQQAMLAYNSYLINPVDETDINNNQYNSNVPQGGNYRHEYYQSSRGGTNKVTANVASIFKYKLLLVINLNAHFADIKKSILIIEKNSNTPQSGVQEIGFRNDLYTYGTGYSFNLGMIYKLTPSLKIGASYESPLWYQLYEELSQSLEVRRVENNQLNTSVIAPNVTNIYEPYRLKTAGKYIGSLSYLFKNRGFISADIIYRDHSITKLSPKRYYKEFNTVFIEEFTQSTELRLGTEFKIKPISLRGGYRVLTPITKSNSIQSQITSFTIGVGYNFKRSSLDLTYLNSNHDATKALISSGMNDLANLNKYQNSIMLSYNMNF